MAALPVRDDRAGQAGRARQRLWPLAGLVAATGCAAGMAGGSAGPGAPVDAAALERVVTPFPVLAEDGSEIGQPFLGGFNIPPAPTGGHRR